jgi:hypothetical protein
MFKVSSTYLQTFIDTPNCVLEDRVQYTNYVIMVSDWNCLIYFCVFLYCNHQVHRDLLITLYKSKKKIKNIFDTNLHGVLQH